MGISRKISKAMEASSWIRKMFEEGALLKKEKGEENVYDFTLGNPITEPPKAFGDKLKALAADSTPGTHAYMPNSGLVGVREKIAAYLKAQTGLPYAFNHITMTVGAAGGLNVTLKALLDPGDEVLTLSPFFVEYGVYADNHGGILKPVPTTEDFLPDLEKLAAAITPATKALIINSPNNPTGVVYPKEVLKALGELLANLPVAPHDHRPFRADHANRTLAQGAPPTDLQRAHAATGKPVGPARSVRSSVTSAWL